jgi:hypothetical protein
VAPSPAAPTGREWEPSPPGTRVTPETIITCVDCGGRAHLLTTWPHDDPPQPGDVMTYHCEDCWERLDLVLPDIDEQSEG